MSSVPLPHPKRFIPLEHDCYHGNYSKKNKYPSVDFDFSEFHKFVNKHTKKEWVKPAYLFNNNLFVTTPIKLTWRESWFHIIVPMLSGKSMTSSQCENIHWVCFDGLLPAPPQPKTTCSSPLTRFAALPSFAEHKANQNQSVWSGAPHCQLCSHFLWDVVSLCSDIWATCFISSRSTWKHSCISQSVGLTWIRSDGQVLFRVNTIKATSLPSLSTWSLGLIPEWSSTQTHCGCSTD